MHCDRHHVSCCIAPSRPAVLTQSVETSISRHVEMSHILLHIVVAAAYYAVMLAPSEVIVVVEQTCSKCLCETYGSVCAGCKLSLSTGCSLNNVSNAPHGCQPDVGENFIREVGVIKLRLHVAMRSCNTTLRALPADSMQNWLTRPGRCPIANSVYVSRSSCHMM